ncbi:MAG: DEAD/DEAH box helicase [Deltaproteobacteria bacterium]|nr:DEAD/DEAH box helicase [Deltaproteobacteria bacterium]
MDAFSDFGLIPALNEAVADMGYTRPTPIQAEAIPVGLAGRDLIGCASTGTGKTAAFLLPILQRLHVGPRGKCRALILSPTRELAMQIDEQALAIGYHIGLTAVSVVGGVDMRPQERALRAGAEIVVATPGRLLDHMRFDYVDLSTLDVLVLDEADRMLDMGFLPDIRRILRALPTERQTMMFSATMPPEIRQLANDILRDPVTIMVGARKPASGIVQSVYPVANARKAALLTTLLRREDMRSVLVFVKRKVDADRLARTVSRSGVGATSIHSDRRQEDRIAALEAFRRGQFPVLIATDVAARGIDVEGISHVVNFDVPFSADDYIHRGGRTARAGAAGEVLTFVAPEEEYDLCAIERAINVTLPRIILPNFDHGTHERVPPAVAMPDASRSRRQGHGGRRRGGSAHTDGARPTTAVESPRAVESRTAESARGAAEAGASDATGPRRRRRRRGGRGKSTAAPTPE